MKRNILIAFILIFCMLLTSCGGGGKTESSKLAIGMNIHRGGDHYLSYPYSDLGDNIDTCAEMGMDIVRYNNSCGSDVDIIYAKSVGNRCHNNGMKCMLVLDTISFLKLESLEEIEEKMYERFKNLSSELRDSIDYYQLFNELDIACMNGDIANIFLTKSDGKEKGEYDSVLWERSVAAFKGAFRGMKDGYPEGKTCINFAWWHTALIYELYDMGLRPDIVGIDWYSDCEEVSSIKDLMADVTAHIPDTDIMICETNYWMNLHERYTEEKKQALKTEEYRNEEQAKWVPEFIDTLIEINNPHLKGVIFYELLDEPVYEESKGSYVGESHFGFIKCDKYGMDKEPKSAYYTLKEKCEKLKNK